MSLETQEAVTKARNLIANNRHAAIATVNQDGSPHNTPFYFIYEADLSRVYWGSHPESVHSKNISRTGETFLVLYDSAKPKQGGLYLLLKRCHELSGSELEQALKVHNSFRSREDKETLELSYYMIPNQQRMYSGEPRKAWVLMSEDDKNDHRLKDYRQEVELNDSIKK